MAPEKPDVSYLKELKAVLTEITASGDRRLIIIIGGGGPARVYQQACKEIADTPKDSLDWIGIRATRLNAELVRQIFSDICSDPVVCNPSSDFSFTGKIMVAAGWKPGFSTDFIAVTLAEKFNAQQVINLSNIKKVYSADPKTDPNAVPLDYINWDDYIAMVGTEWIPGKNAPFDPVATQKAKDLNLQVITAEGRDINNIKAILSGASFNGTVMGRKD